jgi:membrane-associated phospholipid phosphatase
MYETNPLYNVENFDIICNTDFGMPSGHAFLSISICEFILVDYVLPVVKSQYLRIFCILFIALVVISVDFGRIYLGAHSDL